MPARYRQLFRGGAVNEHAAIVARRGTAAAHAEIWRRTPQGAAIVCMPADDHPWLLSFVCTALTAHAIHMVSAHLYARVSDRTDLMCLLWLVREESAGRSVLDADVTRIAELVGGLVTGELTDEVVPRGARHTTPRDAATLIRFEDIGNAARASLVIETLERPGLFRAVTSALQSARVRILNSVATTAQDGRVVLRFSLVEPDGTAPDAHRRDLLQADVLRAVSVVVPGNGSGSYPLESAEARVVPLVGTRDSAGHQAEPRKLLAGPAA